MHSHPPHHPLHESTVHHHIEKNTYRYLYVLSRATGRFINEGGWSTTSNPPHTNLVSIIPNYTRNTDSKHHHHTTLLLLLQPPIQNSTTHHHRPSPLISTPGNCTVFTIPLFNMPTCPLQWMPNRHYRNVHCCCHIFCGSKIHRMAGREPTTTTTITSNHQHGDDTWSSNHPSNINIPPTQS